MRALPGRLRGSRGAQRSDRSLSGASSEPSLARRLGSRRGAVFPAQVADASGLGRSEGLALGVQRLGLERRRGARRVWFRETDAMLAHARGELLELCVDSGAVDVAGLWEF